MMLITFRFVDDTVPARERNDHQDPMRCECYIVD